MRDFVSGKVFGRQSVYTIILSFASVCMAMSREYSGRSTSVSSGVSPPLSIPFRSGNQESRVNLEGSAGVVA